MFKTGLHVAKVVSTKDPDSLGRIQVRVIPGMENALKADLPWVRPFLREGESGQTSLAENSIVWCLFNKPLFKEGFYFPAQIVDSIIDTEGVLTDLSNLEELGQQSSEDVSYTKFPNGTVVFRNEKTGEEGILHASGSYTVFDKDGNLTSKSVGSHNIATPNGGITIANDGQIEANSAGASLKVTSAGLELNGDGNAVVKYNELKSVLDSLLSTLNTFQLIDPLTGLTGTPFPASLAQLTNINTQTPLIKSQTVKTGN